MRVGPVKVPASVAASASASLRSAAASAAALLLLAAPLQDAPVSLPAPLRVEVASARELASGSGARVNKDPLSLLRLGLPAQPRALRDVQASLEDATDSVQRLLLNNAKDSVGKAKGTLKSKEKEILGAVPAASQGEGAALLGALNGAVDEFGGAVAANKPQDAIAKGEEMLAGLSKLEELIATPYKQPMPPKEFAGLPYLNGRATVEVVVKRDGGKFDVDGKLYDQVKVTQVVDGYTAPLTAGNYVDLVQRGFYDGMKIQRSDGFVVQTGDPTNGGEDKTKNGFVEDGKIRKIPLEVFVRGDKAPIYSTTFDDDGRGGYAASLPFNAFGALGMAREEYDADSASSQWFWLLFDSDLTPAGKNLLDGRYACFGYTTDGARLLSDVKEGDTIVSAKVTSGLGGLTKAE